MLISKVSYFLTVVSQTLNIGEADVSAKLCTVYPVGSGEPLYHRPCRIRTVRHQGFVGISGTCVYGSNRIHARTEHPHKVSKMQT